MKIAQFNFIAGDSYLSKKKILEIKKELNVSIEYIDLDQINITEASCSIFSTSLFDVNKIYVVYGLKANKDFLSFVDNCINIKNSHDYYIFWDSNENIYSKSNSLFKSWIKTTDYLRSIGGLFLYPYELLLKDNGSVAYVMNEFNKHGRFIEQDAAQLLIELSGENTAYIHTEIDKLLAIESGTISIDHVYDLGFDTEPIPVMYELTDLINSHNIVDAYAKVLKMLKANVNGNVIIDVLLRRQRWLVIIGGLYVQGKNRKEIIEYVFSMGKYKELKTKDEFREKLKSQGFIIPLGACGDYSISCENIFYKFLIEKMLNFIDSIKNKNNDVDQIFYNKFLNLSVGNYNAMFHICQKIRKDADHERLLFDAISYSCSHKL
jgi:DNA polymerase III delta subunit